MFSKYIHHIGSITAQKFFNPESVNTIHSTCTCGKDENNQALQQQLVWELASTVYDVIEFYGVIPLCNLRSFNVRSRAEYENFSRVAGPCLVDVDFYSSGYNPKRLSPPRSKVFNFSSSLRVFRFHDHHFLNVVSNDSIMQVLRNAHSLRIVHIPDFEVLNRDDFRELLLSKKTWRLEIGSSKSIFEAGPSVRKLEPVFHLEATASHLRHCSNILQKIRKETCSSLYLLRIRICNGMPDFRSALPGMKKFLWILQFLCNHEILAHVEIHLYNLIRSHRSGAQDHPDYKIILDTVSPLFVFRCLERVKISYESNDYKLNCDFKLDRVSDKVKLYWMNPEEPEKSGKKEENNFHVELIDVSNSLIQSAHHTHSEMFVRLNRV